MKGAAAGLAAAPTPAAAACVRRRGQQDEQQGRGAAALVWCKARAAPAAAPEAAAARVGVTVDGQDRWVFGCVGAAWVADSNGSSAMAETAALWQGKGKGSGGACPCCWGSQGYVVCGAVWSRLGAAVAAVSVSLWGRGGSEGAEGVMWCG